MTPAAFSGGYRDVASVGEVGLDARPTYPPTQIPPLLVFWLQGYYTYHFLTRFNWPSLFALYLKILVTDQI